MRDYIRTFASSFTNIEYSAAIIKWQPLIESTAYSVAKITAQDVEDTRQNILLDLAAVADYYARPLYHYRNRVWCVRQQSGRLALIESPAHIVQRMDPRWLYRAWLKPVRKSSANAFVYRRIVQHVPNVATKHFRQRNGFDTTKTQRVVLEKAGTQRTTKAKEIFIPVQKHQRVALTKYIDVSALGYNPEEACLANRVLEGTSLAAQKIARLLLTDGVFADKVLSKRTGLRVRQVKYAKAELHRQLKRQKCPEGCEPVRFGVEHVE